MSPDLDPVDLLWKYMQSGGGILQTLDNLYSLLIRSEPN